MNAIERKQAQQAIAPIGGLMGPSFLEGFARRNLTALEALEGEKVALETRLSHVNEAIDAIKKNPEIQRVLDVLGGRVDR